jgi:hypothetical protein
LAIRRDRLDGSTADHRQFLGFLHRFNALGRTASPAAIFGSFCGTAERAALAVEPGFSRACFPILLSLMTPLDSLTVRGRIYYLSGITALMDNNYALFECDGVGWVCREVYRSGDYSPAEPMHAGLAYDDATNTLSIKAGEHGTIHIYRPVAKL